MKKTQVSKRLFKEARRLLPGGVDSPVRAFKAVGGTPRFIVRGRGSKLYDADGNRYIDYVGSWGPLILGHADPRVTAAVKRVIGNGTSFGAATEVEIRLAEISNPEIVFKESAGYAAGCIRLRLK